MTDVCSALWFGFAVCTFSFLCIIGAVYIDWRQEILIQMKQIVTSNVSIEDINEKKRNDMFSSIKELSKSFFIMCFLITIGYSGILPFNYIATSFLIKTW